MVVACCKPEHRLFSSTMSVCNVLRSALKIDSEPDCNKLRGFPFDMSIRS